ncbi:lanthionine synthetase LanC family protein [Streptomyces sp. NPDC002599]|uniref:lanthionine synthetase LanC family protein n=1 Tax=Streptomyces sp. NPDC002599 TaxID=3154421 RepID=UPI00332280A0
MDFEADMGECRMRILDPLTLAEDVVITPAADVDAEIVRKCGFSMNDFIVTRPRSRTQSKAVDKGTAELLGMFREGARLAEVALRMSIQSGEDPVSLLTDIFSAVQPFIKSGWLAAVGSQEVEAISPSHLHGELIAGYSVLDVVQVLDDTEVFQVQGASGQIGAMKLERCGGKLSARPRLTNEERVLKALNGWPAPNLIEAGEADGCQYVLTSWCPGVTADIAAERIRSASFGTRSADLCRLLADIASAYAELHHRGIVHADVFTKNVLVGTAGEVFILDYGLSRLLSSEYAEIEGLACIAEYSDPELAEALLKEVPPPRVSTAAEQYSLGVLFYRLSTGESYIDFSGERKKLLQQIADSRPRKFSELGIPAWPELEDILCRMLEKDPLNRFSGLGEVAIALRRLASCTAAISSPPPLHRNLDWPQKYAKFSVHDLPPATPTGSVTYGAAGIAYALYAAACSRRDSQLLSAADRWATDALDVLEEESAFSTKDIRMPEAVVNGRSVYYGKPGIHLVRALVSGGLADELGACVAAENYISEASIRQSNADLTLGTAGLLTGTALLLEDMSTGSLESTRRISVRRQLGLLGRELSAKSSEALGQIRPGSYLGLAHGIAGVIYAQLLWSEVNHLPPSGALLSGIELLKGYALEHGRGVRWPIHASRRDETPPRPAHFMESWCHGSPGYVLLWCAASRVLGDPSLLDLAERCAWTVWDAQEEGVTLCCGSAGQAYALLTLARHSGGTEWRARADCLIRDAMSRCKDDSLSHSLFKGRLGVELVAEDAHTPTQSTFPLVEVSLRG